MPDYRQSVPRFSTKTFLLSIACIACGIGLFASVMRGVPYFNPDLTKVLLVQGAFFGGRGLMGAGIDMLFGRTRRWLATGLVIMAVVFIQSFLPTTIYAP
jgi:hypothetical protein